MQKQTFIIVRSLSYEDQRKHFIERLWVRYGLKITDAEYDHYCKPEKIFHGGFSTNKRKTVGWIFINGEKVWVLRDGEANRLATCYPPAVEYDAREMIRSCFGGACKAAAFNVYDMYLREAARVEKMKFPTVKDAALYFFSKMHFAPLHIDKYKHGSVKTIRVANAIQRVLTGTSDYTRLTLRRVPSKKPIRAPKDAVSDTTGGEQSGADGNKI